MITVHAIGGLANRMRSIASGVALASASGRGVKVVWGVNNDLRARFEDLFEPLPVELRNLSAREELWRYDPPRKRNLFLSPLFRREHYSLLLHDDTGLRTAHHTATLARVMNAGGNVLISSGLDYYPFTGKLYRGLFRPRTDILDEACGCLRQLGEDAIGFHIRRTDNRQAIDGSPLELFLDKAGAEIARNPGSKIYLATDDNGVKRLFSSRWPRNIVTSAAQADRRSTPGMRQALVEMLVLGGCHEILGSFYSSYSEAAALLCDTPLTQLTRGK